MIMMIAAVNNILISWLCSRNLAVLQSQLADSRHEAPDPGAGGHADGGLVWFGHADGGLVEGLGYIELYWVIFSLTHNGIYFN